MILFASCLALLGAVSTAPAEEIVLRVDTARVLREGADRFVGIDLNYVRDADANRPQARPLNDALKDLGVRWLRYPGGEKSDFHLFAPPPYEKPAPVSLGWYAKAAGQRMDFDAYVACCRAVGAEPLVVVACDNQKRTGRTWDQWREHAVAWVHYANQVKRYGVRYWEIGNENWHNETAPPAEMAKVVADFSRAMKAVDPTIHVGASANGSDGWSAGFLPTAAPSLDFISVSVYNTSGWHGYDYFPAHPGVDLRGAAGAVLRHIDRYAPPADRARLQVIVTETNSKDFGENPWPGDNSLGHALVTFETLGRLMAEPRIAGAMLWTTRWMKDEEARRSQWYGLGPANEIFPAGRAVALWGRFVRERLVAVEGGSPLVTGYASRSADGRELSVWVVNRSLEAAGSVRVAVTSPVAYRTAGLHRFSGEGPNDADPRWETLAPLPVAGNTVSGLVYPGVSVTVLSFTAG